MSETKAKPTGPIPPYFETLDGELAIGGTTASVLVAEAGDTPLFVYSTAALEARVDELRAGMPEQLGIHYAMKANPFAPLLGWMKGRVDGFDVASGGELKLALDAGVRSDPLDAGARMLPAMKMPRLVEALVAEDKGLRVGTVPILGGVSL